MTDSQPEMVYLCTYNSLPEAQVAKACLDAIDVICFIKDSGLSQLYGGSIGVQLFVRSDQTSEARKALKLIAVVE